MAGQEFRFSILVLKEKIEVVGIFMGKDLNVMIKGGDTPHIGSISIADPGNDKIQTIVFPGHKDQFVGDMFAGKLSEKLKSRVVVSCGIHYDGLSKTGIHTVCLEMKKLLKEVLESLSRQ